jgi:hypothetical protein
MRLGACALLLAASCGDTSGWRPVGTDLPVGALGAAWATGGELFAVGGTSIDGGAMGGGAGGAILHYDGHAWTRMANPAPAFLWWVFGFGPSDVWAAGEQGTILHYDGSAWTAVPSGGATDAFYGLWGADPGEIWAVGGSVLRGPQLRRWDGHSFTPAPPGTAAMQTLFKVWGTDRSHVFIVGTGGITLTYDGSSWHADAAVTDQGLVTVHGRSATDVWAVGGNDAGVVLHRGGSGWAIVPSAPDFPPLLGVYAGADAIWIAGRDGFIASQASATGPWQTVANTGTSECLHNVAPYGDGYVATGGNLLVRTGLLGVILRKGSAISTHIP